MKMYQLFVLTLMMALFAGSTKAAEYKFDIKGQHAFIHFKVKHLGFSYIVGGFNKFDGSFSYDAANPAASSANVTIDVDSLDSNHAERDKHLRGDDYLNASKYPTITFRSTEYIPGPEWDQVKGMLAMHGVTREVVLDVMQVGEGKDPWGGYRSGFTGTTTVKATDFNLPAIVGDVQIEINIEGVRK